jgi:HAD superfamily hydrolase (TIGR01549 family)
MPTPKTPPELLDGVELLSLDAGNTVIFLDHARLARLVASGDFAPSAAELVRAEGRQKHRAELGTLVGLDVAPLLGEELADRAPSVGSWARAVGTILVEAGCSEASVARRVADLWLEHVRLNLWSLVPEGLPEALLDLRRRGVKVAIVSNSEGMLEPLFAALGLGECFDVVVDSGKVGVEKPDPRIFQIALDATGVRADRTLHLGDIFATDILGARRSGIRYGLIDPYDHYAGRHDDVPRVRGAVQVARDLAAR